MNRHYRYRELKDIDPDLDAMWRKDWQNKIWEGAIRKVKQPITVKETESYRSTIHEVDVYAVFNNPPLFLESDRVYLYTKKITKRNSKYLCIGGPFHGQKKTCMETAGDYEPFNRSYRDRWKRKKGNTQIFVHRSVLGE